MKPLSVRPYQLLCLICRRKAGYGKDPCGRKLHTLLSRIRKYPDRPLSMNCNVESVYDFQNPGNQDDTPEGELFNLKRDLDILQRLGLAPGAVHPARDLFKRIMAEIKSPQGFCGYPSVTSDTWRGCIHAGSGDYEHGIDAGINALIQPRDPEIKACAKSRSVTDMYQSSMLEIRPHHLMCMTCFHAGRTTLTPIAEDNLFEAIDIIQKNPDIPVKLVRASQCVICPPCSAWNPETCKCVTGCSLRDQKKDLDVLQKTGLKYGDILSGQELLKRLYAAIASTREVCGCGDGIARSFEWTGCGREGNERYVEGRAAGLGVKGVT